MSHLIMKRWGDKSAAPLKMVAGFNLELWNKLGMSFNPNGRYSQKEMKAKAFLEAGGRFENLFFNLRIDTKTGNTKATVSNAKGEKIGNHMFFGECDLLEMKVTKRDILFSGSREEEVVVNPKTLDRKIELNQIKTLDTKYI